MLTYISIFVTAIFVNNIVLSQFLGICPFLGVSKRIDSALGMGAAVTFVMTIATIVTYLLQTYLLMPMKLDYMQTIVFILVIAALVQLLEIIIKKMAPSLSGLRRFPAINHYKLHDIGCRIDRYSKKSVASRSYRLYHIDSNRIHIGFGNLCRDA